MSNEFEDIEKLQAETDRANHFERLATEYQLEAIKLANLREELEREKARNRELMTEAQEAQKLREILTNLLKRHHTHSGGCCIFDRDQIVINERTCQCTPEEKKAYSILGWPRLWK